MCIPAEALLELRDVRALHDPPAFQRELNCPQLFIAEDWFRDRDRQIGARCR
jgi:hypothetical protein